jgi:plastocyanin
MRALSRVLFLSVIVGALVAPGAPARAGGFCSGYNGERPTAARGSTVRMNKNCFGPTVLYVDAGEAVTFVNDDPEAHTVGGAAGSFGDMHKEIPPGESFTHTFGDAGVYPYVCLVHPGMAGAVVVGDGAGAAASAPVAASDDGLGEEPGSRSQSASSSGVPVGTIAAAAFLVAVAAVVAWLARADRRRRAAPERA